MNEAVNPIPSNQKKEEGFWERNQELMTVGLAGAVGWDQTENYMDYRKQPEAVKKSLKNPLKSKRAWGHAFAVGTIGTGIAVAATEGFRAWMGDK